MIKSCEFCGTEFRVSPSRESQRFCSHPCSHKSPRVVSGVRTFEWRGEKLSSADFERRGIFPHPRTADRLRNKYGMEPEDFVGRVEEQGRLCPINGSKLVHSGPNGLNVDHCHVTGKTRGVLSGPANKALGLLDDSAHRLMSLAFYILEDPDLGEYSRDSKPTSTECDVCCAEETLCVDHDHQTNKVRGTLCRKCNLALGYLNDSPENCLAARRYLLCA